MKNINRFIFSLAALLIASGLAMTAPALADHGSDDSSNTTTSSSGSGDSDDATTSTTSDDTENEVEVHNLTTRLRHQGETELEAHKQDIKQHTQAQRQKACEARKAGLTRRMNNAVSWAQRHKQVIDTAYTRVKDFHDSKNLNVANYSLLTTAVDAAQANAQNGIGALQALDISVDCTSQTVATSVSAFQQAVKNTRDSLKVYRTTLVQLIEVMKGASTGANNSTGDDSTNSPSQ